MNCVLIFYNLSTTILQLIEQYYFIHPFDVNGFCFNPLQFIYNYFTSNLMNIFYHISFIHLTNGF